MENKQEIPKVIHYCWFGGKPLPQLAKKCIASWKKYLPDYEIKRWDESNFNVNIIPYTKESYEAKKYAFVSDYARLWILYNYGGIYFDTDVEVIKSLEPIIENGPFLGFEDNEKLTQDKGEFKDLLINDVNPGLGMAAYPSMLFYKELMSIYENKKFKLKDNKINLIPIGHYTTKLLQKKGLEDKVIIQNIDNINIYPKEYFCPINYHTNNIHITSNTYTIHHFSASWISNYDKFKKYIAKLIGKNNTNKIIKLKELIKTKNLKSKF